MPEPRPSRSRRRVTESLTSPLPEIAMPEPRPSRSRRRVTESLTSPLPETAMPEPSRSRRRVTESLTSPLPEIAMPEPSRSRRRVTESLTRPAAELGTGQLTENVRSILAAITDRPVGARPGLVTHVELGIVVEVGTTKLAHVGEVVQSGLWQPVGQRELEDFTNKVLTAIEAVGIETVSHAADEILRDRSRTDTLRKAAQQVGPLSDMADRAAEKLEPTDPTRRRALRWWILAGAILLAAGVAAVALVGSVTAEIVLTNELALAAVAAALAALLKGK